MKKSTRLVVYAALAYILLSLSVSAQVRSTSPPPHLPSFRQVDSLRRIYQAEQERRTLDPALNRVPAERLNAIYEQLAPASGSINKQQARAGIPNVTWTERGPSGFTGTIRSLLVDPGDTTKRTVWAGSTTGGLWKNANLTDAVTSWTAVSDAWESKNLSALATDPTNSSIIYAATGDPINATIGGGIWKSVDRGKTWLRLSATIPLQTGTLLQVAFSQIAGLAVTKTGILLAGTKGGVLRSADQGQTWQFALAPQQQIGGQTVSGGNDRVSAIRAGHDGLMYVALATGRLFRSTSSAATAWTEITPPNTAPYNGIRTELAVAAPTSGTAQIVYAAKIAADPSSGGYTLHWLMQSANSGQTWQVMNRPVYADAPDQDVTLGLGDQYFTITASPDTAQVVYLTAYDQLYRSGNSGVSWSTVQIIGRTTAFLPLPKLGIVWSSVNQVNYAPTQQLFSQGLDPAQHNRSTGFGGLDVAGVAMKNVANDSYRLIGSAGEPGLLETSAAANAQVTYPAYPLRPFIDQNEPGVQIAATTNGGFLTRDANLYSSWDYLSSGSGIGDYPDGGVDYDSRSNTFFFWSDGYMKATGIGTNPVISPLGSTTLTRPTCLKVGRNANTLFSGTINSTLYKISGTNQTTPTLTRIDGGAFPQGSTISSIDVGATDSVLVVTLSNYGVQSVWYTTNAGTNWVSKDLPAYGLPDMPVYSVLFNPADRRQVMLATEVGVWSTSDITAANPGWVLTNSAAPLMRYKQLVYRVADGRVATVTNGRGVWETTAWSSSSPALVAGPLSTTSLCAGSTFPVAFTLSNAPASSIVVRLSNASGDFNNGSIIATGLTSPLTATVTSGIPSGNGYRLRLEAADLNLTTVISNTLTISNVLLGQARIVDRRQTLDTRLAAARYSSGYVCPGDLALLRASLPDQPTGFTATYQWALDGQPLSGQTSATLLTGQTGTYSFTARVGGCTTTNADNFLLISVASPTASVVNAINPADGPACPGTSLPLGISYLGERATYQWLRNGAAIAGATSLVRSVTATGAYSYSLTFSESGTSASGTCTATAPPVYMTFSQTILPPTIAVGGDVAPTLCSNESLRLYATSQPDETTYQWLQNGKPIGSQSNSFIDVDQAGTYSLQIKRGACLAVSDPIGVTANSQLSNGFYFYGSTSLCAGETLVLYAKNTNHTLQWTKNNVPIPGATGFAYSVSTPGNYGLNYVSGGCSGTAVAVSIVFSQTLTPALLLSERCTDVELSTPNFPQAGPVSFSWLRNGQSFSQGTQAYQTVTTSGLYSVSFTNGVCGGLSKLVSVTIGQVAKPVIQAVGDLTRCPTSAVTLLRVSGPYSYWKRNGLRIDGASSDRLVAAESGVYSLVYEQGSCLTESASLSVAISQPASATFLANQLVIKSGQSAVLPVQLSGISPWSFSIASGLPPVTTSQNPYSLTVTPSRSTSYSLVTVANRCGVGSAQGVVQVVVVFSADVSLTSWVDKRLGQPSDSVAYMVRVTNAGPDAAENITLINRLPAGLSYAGSYSAIKGDTLRYYVGNVPAGESRLFTFKARANRLGTYLNAIEVIACDTPDPDSQPNTGTGDGEDDATLVDWRTPDSNQYVAVSPNPNGRVLPAVVGNQPAPVPNQADLSAMLTLSKRTAQLRDTIQVTMRVHNRGGAATSSVQTGLTLPNGTYSFDKITWQPVSAVLPISIGQIGVNATVSRTVYWLPAASASCRFEVTSSSVPDSDSTPNNHATRPGEDDEATADIRVLR